jgi:predicted ribosome quality control (RQC) complex YloA/Tae2 family protein
MEKMYREIYNSIYEVMVKAVSDHDDDVAELLERRFQKMSAEDFDTMLSQTYKSKLERAEKTYATKIEQMNKEITILRKHLKTNKERADLLNSELIRIKNLL